ncbi:hypothetical protein TSUD_158750 [Trifolium subterraneum]|uniref:Leucine-rich repeat-containing N-terminal plant-type domain-containing protein n=1 Tax=Trifolium subterraneum TaxID=3900 RepID=A0A2Z6N1N2_TRISU|nr:hypothetical protein TSUD_158750 [Trifolium subterraneum]
MKTLHQQSVLYYFSILLFIVTTIVIVNGDDEEDYMFELLKTLTTTPTGWSNNTHYCKWNGIVCRSSRVVAIKLPSSSLSGSLPPYINSLNNLTHTDLHNNSLIGPLPYLTELYALETVLLGHNNFTSIIDLSFEMLPNLLTLNLSNNLNLSPWVLPIYLKHSSLLQTLDLEATNIIGSLPSEMFNWFPNLNTVFLSHNNITGTLPPSLGKSGVKYLRFNDQGAWNGDDVGTIDVISSMRFLSQAWLHNNLFSGQIPNMSNCTYLFDLQLHSNQLTGLVPHSLLALSSLKNISLDDNYLQGPLPVFHKGVKATWEGNEFCRNDSGPCDSQVTIFLEIIAAFGYPDFLTSKESNPCIKRRISYTGVFITCERGKIVSISLENMQLSGTISPAFSNLSNLVNLTLANNNLMGLIPYSLTTLPQLRLLDVSNNNLCGQLPRFPSKVNLTTRGNALLGQNISQTLGGGENETASHHGSPSKTTKLKPFWIADTPVIEIEVEIG